MFDDVLTYACRSGTVNAHIAAYAEHGFEIQKRHPS